MSYSFSEIHLPGQHMVVFDPNKLVHAIALRATSEQTTLTQFFNMNCLENSVSVQARNLTYQDFPHDFVWHKDTKTWTKWQKGFSLGHIYFVPLTSSERFYLRMLWTISHGARSFTDLCTYQDIVYPTFQDVLCLGFIFVIRVWSLTSFSRYMYHRPASRFIPDFCRLSRYLDF